MAYASKYYDPVKAHEYYMRTRELKGYENRYGGARGNGTSAANGYVPPRTEEQKRASETRKHNDDINESIRSLRAASRQESESNRNANNSLRTELKSIMDQDRELRKSLQGMSKLQRSKSGQQGMTADERKAKRQEYRDLINANRETLKQRKLEIQDEIQRLRQSMKGGSTAGFNRKGMEAAAYIRNQMDKERDELIKSTNKAVDRDMLKNVEHLAADMKAMRENGYGGSHSQFGSRIKALLGEAKKSKTRHKRKQTAAYKQKYKDEIDKLRGDDSMFTYWDRRRERSKL